MSGRDSRGVSLSRRGFLGAVGSVSVGLGLPAGASVVTRTPSDAGRPRPTPAQLRWQREELSMFVHLGISTYTDREWGDGTESPALFNPRKLDARQWVRTAKQAGFRSMILTAKHHDGFCLWPSTTTSHTVAGSPWRDGGGDVVREFTDACREQGLRAGLYLSPWDRNHPSYGHGRAYDDIYIAQLTELLTGYGPLSELWFDGANGEGSNGRRQRFDWPRIHATVRRLQPDAVMFSDAGPDLRWVGNETGSAAASNWSTVDPARVPAPGANDPWTVEALQQGDPDGSIWRPAETDVSIRPGWFWHETQNKDVRSADSLLGLYFSSVGRNSKLLLNVPPNGDGLFDAPDVAALAGFSERRRQVFATDLLQGARVRDDAGRDAAMVLDGNPDTFWQPAPGAQRGALEFHLPAPVAFDVIRLEEAIAQGQGIAGYRVQLHDGRQWRTISWGSTIGHARLARIAPVVGQRLRVLIDFCYDTSRVSRVALFRDPASVTVGRRADDHGDT